MIESDNFAYWLSIHIKPSILPSEVKALKEIMYRSTDADLISIMYHGKDELALKALKELRIRFQDEMHSLEQANRDQTLYYSGANNADSWN
jgi:hypothetical protein